MSVSFTAPDMPKAEDGMGEYEVNMSNSNAVRVAESLGFRLDPDGDGDLYGQMDATEFLGHVLMALALAPADEGMPAFELSPGDSAGIFGVVREGGPRFIQGARRPGYLQDRLRELHALAEWAVANSQPVQWG